MALNVEEAPVKRIRLIAFSDEELAAYKQEFTQRFVKAPPKQTEGLPSMVNFWEKARRFRQDSEESPLMKKQMAGIKKSSSISLTFFPDKTLKHISSS